jgi:hypothetical protein
MQDVQKLIEGLNYFLKSLFGDQIAQKSLKIILAVIAVYGFFWMLAKFLKLWDDELKPRFYNPEEKKTRQASSEIRRAY